MEKKVLATIEKYKLIKPSENIVIGVSGGADSMALLYLLNQIRNSIAFKIFLAHINHGVRGKDADRDEDFVKLKAKDLSLPCFTKRVDMEGHARDRGISPEEAGRELRYGFFKEVLDKVGGGKIAVAHNMNDQAETLLMRVFRGTGIDGLKGMEFISNDIIRPLLNISRGEIEDYIKENNIDTVLDETNLKTIYTRNKIRLDLIPYIERNFNPNIIKTLWRLGQVASLDSKFLEAYSTRKLNSALKYEDKNCIILNAELFGIEDISIQQRIIRLMVIRLTGNLHGFSEHHVSFILNLFLSGETGKMAHLPNDIYAEISYGDLILRKGQVTEYGQFLYELNMGVNQFSDIGYRICLTVLPKEKMGSINRGANVRFFDYAKVSNTLYIRRRNPGDSFLPFGMQGSKKIKDYFIDEKVPRDMRDKIPLIIDGENILWVVGYRTSDLYKIGEDTRDVLMIKYSHLGAEED